MKITEKIIDKIADIIRDKKVLEIACGEGSFSLKAAKLASEVLATDISLSRFNSILDLPISLKIKEMDASKLKISDENFDVVASYNAFGHLEGIEEKVINEMYRVTKKKGNLIFIATWKMDKKKLSKIQEIINKRYSMDFREISTKEYQVYIFNKS